MVQLEIRNSRMKDFYDIWALSETFAFDGFELQHAVERCFERRGHFLDRRDSRCSYVRVLFGYQPAVPLDRLWTPGRGLLKPPTDRV